MRHRQQVMPVRYRLACLAVLGGHFWAQHIPADHPVHRDRLVANNPDMLWCAGCLAIKDAPMPPSVSPVVDKTATVKSMQWCRQGCADLHHDNPLAGHDAAEIVAWVNANGGEARYEAESDYDDGFYSPGLSGRIAVRTCDGKELFCTPGQRVVMGETFFPAPGTAAVNGVPSDVLRDFTVSS